MAGGRIAARAVVAGALCVLLGIIGFNYVSGLSNGQSTDRFATTFNDPDKALHADRATFFDQFDYLVTNAPFGVGIGRVGGASQLNSGPDAAQNAIFSEAYLGNMIAETGIAGALLIFCIAVFFLFRGMDQPACPAR